MKKISIVLAILAVFLVFSCSNAAGPVDNAGNPVDLAGSWSGSVAYKAEQLAPVSIFTKVTIKPYSDYDYQGTWVKENTVTKASKDYDDVSNTYGTDYTSTTTTKYIFNTPTVTTTEQKVIAADGGIVNTKVEKTEIIARAAITPVVSVTTGAARTNTKFVVYSSNDTTKYATYTYNADVDLDSNPAADAGFDVAYTNMVAGAARVSAIPAVIEGVKTVTTTTTVAVTKQDNGLYTEATTTVVKTEQTGKAYSSPYANTPSVTTETYSTTNSNYTVTDLAFVKANLLNDASWNHTVKVAAKKQVPYADDVTETITFVVAKDGTYTLTDVKVVTQAAAAAVEATDTHYAAAERKAGTLTTTTTTKGTVAAWTQVSEEAYDYSYMVLSSQSQIKDVVGADDLKNNTENTDYSVLEGTGKYEFKILTGEGKKDDTIKTRLFVQGLDNNVVIFDKAPEAAK